MRYLSIDLETTGLDPQRNNIIEFAAVLENTKCSTVAVADLPYFHCFVEPPEGGYVGSPVALGMNGSIFQAIGELIKQKPIERVFNLVAVEHLGEMFKDWLRRYDFDLSRGITCAGKNFASFDLQFIKRWLPGFPRVHHRCLDPMMLFVRPEDETPPDTKTCCLRAGIDGTVSHVALDDARQVIELLRAGGLR